MFGPRRGSQGEAQILPRLARLSFAFGLIWAGLVLAAGMIANDCRLQAVQPPGTVEPVWSVLDSGLCVFVPEPSTTMGADANATKGELGPEVDLSPAAERLIARHIESVGALDVLLLLHETHARDWTMSQLCEQLRCPETWAASRLEQLAQAGLVAQVAPGRVSYQHDREYGPAADEIARACRHARATIVALIFARPGITP